MKWLIIMLFLTSCMPKLDSADDANIEFGTPTSLRLITPTSLPSNNTTPIIEVSGLRPGSRLRIYLDSACHEIISDTLVTSTTQRVTTSSLPTSGTYYFYARQISETAELSSCSESFVEYELDITPPATPAMPVLTFPLSSPATDQNPTFSVSNLTPGESLLLCEDGQCETILAQKIITNTTELITSSDLTTGVHMLYAAQMDSLGNISDCSPISSYEVLSKDTSNYVMVPHDTNTTGDLMTSIINDIVFDSNGNIYVAGLMGVGYSYNGGISFGHTTVVQGLTTLDQWSIHVDSYGNIYSANPNNSLNVSYDKGQSFTDLEITHVNTVSSSDDGTLYLATYDSGFYVSTDHGQNFTQYTTADGLPTNNIRSIEVDGNTLYLSTNLGVVVTDPSFETFTLRDSGLSNVYSKKTQKVDSLLYVLTNDGLYVSTNEGVSFSLVYTVYAYDFLVDRSDIFLVGDDLIISNNSGSSFYTSPLDIHYFSSIAINGSNLYLGGKSGLYVSTDRGQSFSQTSNEKGFFVPWVEDYALAGDNTIYLAMSEGLFHLKSENELETIYHMDSVTELWSWSVATTPYYLFYLRDDGLYRMSYTNLQTMVLLQSIDTADFAYNPVVRTSSDGQLIIFNKDDYSYYVSSNYGLSFTLNESAFALGPQILDISIDSQKNIYFATGGGLYKSTDYGATVSEITIDPTQATHGTEDMQFMANGNFYVIYGNDLYKSTDDLQTFTKIDSVTDIFSFFVSGDESEIYVNKISNEGVFYSDNGGITFTAISSTAPELEAGSYLNGGVTTSQGVDYLIMDKGIFRKR